MARECALVGGGFRALGLKNNVHHLGMAVVAFSGLFRENRKSRPSPPISACMTDR